MNLFKKENLFFHPVVLFVLFSFIVLLLYFPTHHSGLIFDFNGWALRYETATWRDVFTCFDYPGLHQLYHIPFYICYTLFRLNGWGWYIAFAIFHAAVTLSAFLASKNLMKLFGVRNASFLALLASFFFLISPYAIDVVSNKVTIHYFVSAGMTYSVVALCCLFLLNRKTIYLYAAYLMFFISLFSLEITYATPIIIAIIFFFHHYWNTRQLISRSLLVNVLPFFFILGGFLLLHKLVVGSLIGHYGAETHLNADIPMIVGNLIKHTLRYVLFFNHWPYPWKENIHQIVTNDVIAFVLLGLFVAFSAVVLFLQKTPKKARLLLLMYLLFCASLVPVITLYYTILHGIESERYGYLASIFMYTLIVLGISFIRVKTIRIVLYTVFFIASSYCLYKNIHAVSLEGKVSMSLIETFRWESYDHIIILAHTDHVLGARNFSYFGELTSFSESLYLEKGMDLRKQIEGIYQYNMNAANDSFWIEQIEPYTFHVEFAQWGSWFWKEHLGAVPIDNESYTTSLEGKAYTVAFKNPQPNTVVICQQGISWEEVASW